MQTQLSVDSSQLVNTLRHAFTKRSNVLGELMQNSRRAKASKIAFTLDGQNLTIEDDGCGIDNFSELLTVASSGWDLETMNQESPFGLGFLAAIYSCTHIRIESNQQSFECDTKDLLALKPVEICPSSTLKGTKIKLSNIDYPIKMLESDITTLVRGFPIPVFLNGEELFRPDCVNGSLTFQTTDVGDFHIKGIHDDTFKIYSNTRVYLQGLPIHYNGDNLHGIRRDGEFLTNLGDRSFEAKNVNIIHLDSKKYVARVPDRDVLINPNALEAELKNIVLKCLKECLMKEKEYYTEDLFVERRWDTVFNLRTSSDLKPIFNDVGVIPTSYFARVDEYPVILRSDENCDFLNTVHDQNSFTEEELFESNKIVMILDDLSQDTPDLVTAYMFAYHCDKALVMRSDCIDLDKDHWLFSYFESGDEAEDLFNVEVIGSIKESHFDTGVYVNKVHVEFCDHVLITHKTTKTEVKCHDAMWVPDDEEGNIYTVLQPIKDNTAYILSQLFDWSNEGVWLDDQKEYDENLYQLFLLSETTTDSAFIIKTLLENAHVGLYPLLLDTEFKIALSKDGELDVHKI